MDHMSAAMGPCLLCGGDALGPAFPWATRWNGKEFRYLECGLCRATFVDPLPSDEDFRLMYAGENYHDIHYQTLDSTQFEKTLARVRPLLSQTRDVLDYGCGIGGFLVAAAQAGMRSHGVEFDAAARERAKKNTGIEVHVPQALARLGLKFDLIHLGDVLEHLPDPKAVFLRLRSLLNPGGLFLVEGPLQRNASPVFWCSAGVKRLRRALGVDRPGSSPPTHLVLTDRMSQKKFFTETLSYECLFYELDETGWPYIAGPLVWRSPAALVKRLIGYSAIALSALRPPASRFLGNRFVGVFRP